MIVLDLGCGQATISKGVAEVVPHGRVLGVDIDRAGLATARGEAATIGCGNLAFAAADGRQLPFRSGVFAAVLCHSILETLNDPTSVVTEVRRVMKRGGVVGAASVEYGGIILGGAKTTDPQRFYDIRQLVWRARELPNRIQVVACAGCFRRRDLIASRPPPTISAMAPRIGLSPSRTTAPRNAGISDCRLRLRVTGLPRQKNSTASRLRGKNGVAILEPSLLSRGVGYWLGLDRRWYRLRPSVKRARLAKVRSPPQLSSFSLL